MYTIGELAKRSGVPVKTIRFWSDEGVLPEAERTPSGYRLYTDADRIRLELIRTLRDLGLDLPTIRTIVQRQGDLGAAVALQLEAVELQLRSLRRTRAVLCAALGRGQVDPAHLARLHALTRLERAERERLVHEFLDRAVDGVPVDRSWVDGMRQAMVPDLPEDPSTAQLDAFLELMDLFADEDLTARLRTGAQAFWERADGRDLERHARETTEVALAAHELAAAGVGPEDPAGASVLDRLLKSYADVWGQPVDAALAASLLRQVGPFADPRVARQWELLAIVNGWPPRSRPAATGWAWLVAALRARAGAVPTGQDADPVATGTTAAGSGP